MDKTSEIISFHLAIQLGSFTKAAEQLGISPAAVGKQIQRLEAEYNTSLFNRTTRKIELTEAGQAFYEESKKLLQQLDDLKNLMSSLEGEPSGLLRISINYIYGHHWLLPLLPGFLATYPKLKVDVDIADRYPDFKSEDFDILILVGTDDAEPLYDLKVAKLGVTRFAYSATPNYLAVHGMPEMPNDFLKHHIIAHSNWVPKDVLHFKSRPPLPIEPYISVSTTQGIKQAILGNLGIGLLEYESIHQELVNGQLIELLPEEQDTNLIIGAYYRQSRFQPPKIRALIDYLKQHPRQSYKS